MGPSIRQSRMESPFKFDQTNVIGIKYVRELCLLRRLYRANAGASAAFNTNVFINHIFPVAFRDGADGALCSAGAAADAVVTDFISHESLPPYITLLRLLYFSTLF